ncbi:hypothetical protein AB0M92_38595 [Streptomyces sp. NPDC051582]|uniref:hypothetical protein n=1 Tax=Streptomyces sp. NPDC051582 TaxID=3155167 RepID=UPI003447F1AC
MRRTTSGLLSIVILGGFIVGGGADTASASNTGGPKSVDPVGERRAMCTVYKDKNACASLMQHGKMTNAVKNCLLKAGIGGAAAFIVGRYVSKDVAKDIASKVVVAGASACLSALA